jgi:hypothetical protein
MGRPSDKLETLPRAVRLISSEMLIHKAIGMLYQTEKLKAERLKVKAHRSKFFAIKGKTSTRKALSNPMESFMSCGGMALWFAFGWMVGSFLNYSETPSMF